ncbi:aurkb-a [Symbiodinium sp. CCMP2592]|nr:aurkb-a [Symbiodinium sp. CCMP2592]
MAIGEDAGCHDELNHDDRRMTESGANISVQQGATPTDTAVCVEGTSEAVGKAAVQIQQMFDDFTEAEKKAKMLADSEHMDQVEIPQKLLSAAVGPNGSDLPKVRERCGGVMIALMPPSEGGHLTAFIGPGTVEQVDTLVMVKVDQRQKYKPVSGRTAVSTC